MTKGRVINQISVCPDPKLLISAQTGRSVRDKNRRETRPYSSASKLKNTVLLLGLHPFHTSSPNRCAVYAYPKYNCQTRPYACRPYAQVPGAKTRAPLSL